MKSAKKIPIRRMEKNRLYTACRRRGEDAITGKAPDLLSPPA
jgi:hypothetical protein